MNNKELILIINGGNMSKKLAFIVFILLLVFSCSKEKVADQTVEEYEQDVSIYGVSWGNIITPLSWVEFKDIRAEYSSKKIEDEYFKNNYSVEKIYSYWILREREWHNLSIIKEDLLKRGKQEIGYAPDLFCSYDVSPLSDVIEWDYDEFDDVKYARSRIMKSPHLWRQHDKFMRP